MFVIVNHIYWFWLCECVWLCSFWFQIICCIYKEACCARAKILERNRSKNQSKAKHEECKLHLSDHFIQCLLVDIENPNSTAHADWHTHKHMILLLGQNFPHRFQLLQLMLLLQCLISDHIGNFNVERKNFPFHKQVNHEKLSMCMSLECQRMSHYVHQMAWKLPYSIFSV